MNHQDSRSKQNHHQKHTGLERVFDKLQDVAGGMLGKAVAKTAGWMTEAAFVRNAFSSNMFEIASSRIALQHARSPKIKEMAHRLSDDHNSSFHQLKSAVQMNEIAEGVEIPDSIDARRRALIDTLQHTPADEFDATYLEQQVQAHKEGIELMTGYRDKGSNPQLRSYAASMAPVMERHLRHVEKLRKEILG